jgi:hypothetical protein
MDHSNIFTRKPLMLAFAISLLLHAVVLFFRLLMPESPSSAAQNSTKSPPSRLDITMARPEPMQMVPSPARPAEQLEAVLERSKKQNKRLEKPPAQQAPGLASDLWGKKSWTAAERADMDSFLNELAVQAKPPTGREMAKRALASVREMAPQRPESEAYEVAAQQAIKAQKVDPFSMEMYFDAFVRKLNRSAAFVKNEPRGKGRGKALVQILLNSDGSLKSFRVLRADDQQAEIAYIKSVVDRAAPFSAFPPDVRNTFDSLSILMCILPANAGGGGFSRSFSGQDC